MSVSILKYIQILLSGPPTTVSLPINEPSPVQSRLLLQYLDGLGSEACFLKTNSGHISSFLWQLLPSYKMKHIFLIIAFPWLLSVLYHIRNDIPFQTYPELSQVYCNTTVLNDLSCLLNLPGEITITSYTDKILSETLYENFSDHSSIKWSQHTLFIPLNSNDLY